jgi:hypothetical protein
MTRNDSDIVRVSPSLRLPVLLTALFPASQSTRLELSADPQVSSFQSTRAETLGGPVDPALQSLLAGTPGMSAVQPTSSPIRKGWSSSVERLRRGHQLEALILLSAVISRRYAYPSERHKPSFRITRPYEAERAGNSIGRRQVHNVSATAGSGYSTKTPPTPGGATLSYRAKAARSSHPKPYPFTPLHAFAVGVSAAPISGG